MSNFLFCWYMRLSTGYVLGRTTMWPSAYIQWHMSRSICLCSQSGLLLRTLYLSWKHDLEWNQLYLSYWNSMEYWYESMHINSHQLNHALIKQTETFNFLSNRFIFRKKKHQFHIYYLEYPIEGFLFSLALFVKFFSSDLEINFLSLDYVHSL